ncbi:hypothetical protein HYS47_00760 [Candidatus Woesearchaeota archaeon]|nr:hypothetical protein [Candidatus Woesearchaeota archaeon]
MTDEDIRIKRGKTEIVIKGRLLRKLLSYPPLLNALILTGILVLLLFLLDMAGNPLIISDIGVAWNFTGATSLLSFLTLFYLFIVGRHYYQLFIGGSQ